jgi:Outer membrane protein beta-barrel family
VYANFNREWGKFSLQTGLRLENTIAKGTQLATGQAFDRNYTNLFPTTFFNYKFSEKYEMGLNLSRRLDRPTYRQLNPFKFFLDPTTYNEGNPFLNPQFTWSAEWNHTLAQRYNFTLAYSRTFDNITQVIGPVEGVERVTVQTDRNLAQVEYLSAAFSAPIPVTKWWNSTQNFNVWRGRYIGNFANTDLRDGNLVAHWTMNNAFTFQKDWSAELNFTYKTDEIYGFMHLDPMWGLGFGVQKLVWQKRATIKLAATDVFWTNLPSAVIRYRDYTETFEVFRETRQVTASLTYRFGNNQVAQARRRVGGAEEEKRRAGNG